jgi:hypothetical protein
MPDRHKQKPISIRPSADLRAWLETYAERNQRPIRAVIIEALAAYRESTEGSGCSLAKNHRDETRG